MTRQASDKEGESKAKRFQPTGRSSAITLPSFGNEPGATNFTAAGHVYNLKKLSDFSGNYVAAGAGITIAGGGTATYLKNEHGVVIKLIATDVGLKFKLSADGVHVSLKS